MVSGSWLGRTETGVELSPAAGATELIVSELVFDLGVGGGGLKAGCLDRPGDQEVKAE